ncbi:hypothetical protein F5Y13DRAFT_192772 [Hypoxylon sp. FL1857]|nr:hypothetical protein F5Y13DRAFT_192772 [Hypoxylon sp. FL1857]
MPSKNTITGTHTQAGRVPSTPQSILAYITSVANGDAPVTTLLQQQSAEEEVAARGAKVQREVHDAMNKYEQPSTKICDSIERRKMRHTSRRKAGRW